MMIRQATKNDFDALYALWQTVCLQLYPQADELQRFEAMLDLNPELCLVLVNEANIIVGSIMGAFDGRTASIHRLAVAQDLQKQGWGKKLIAELEKILAQKGIKKVVAQVLTHKTDLVPFYEKLGFTEMTYAKTYYKDL